MNRALKYKLETIENALRMTGNIYKTRSGETAYSREFNRAEKYIKEVIEELKEPIKTK